MLRVFYGPDSFSQMEALAALRAELDSDSMLSANTSEFDVSDADLAAAFATCDTVPFLSANRLVIVKNLIGQNQTRRSRSRPTRRSAAATEAAVDPIDQLVEYVQRMPPTTTLLLLEGDVRQDSAGLRALAGIGDLRHFPQILDQDLIAWISDRAKRLEARIEPRAATLLAQSLRGDLWALSGEIEKLSLYARDRAISETDVRALVSASQESNIFAMVDAIIAGAIETALRELQHLLADGAAAAYLIAMISRQYRQLIVIADLSSTNEPLSVIGAAAEIRSEAALRRAIQRARRLNQELLCRGFERILEADLSIKRGEVEETLAIELLVNDLSNMQRGAIAPSRSVQYA
jgi:DNA polymerase III subunit delta